ncbi:hypothetical protein [Acinetobacter sp.]|uniref:hypothetical protein n=1 Tax=Acinetobacter sp. TaxID=472 RepID=UPI003D037414
MNLIDQFGGYEKAKRALEREIRLTSPNTFYCLKLDEALLQHRRQHNIFESGDICKLKVKHDYGLYKFLRINNDRAYFEDRLGFAEFGIDKHVVEHATDEEIKAGKRLEVG